ncbi:MAG TPA: hypothetical protein VHC69_16360 [Polyangiaceae bacterium]|nr:hypothetical protein [Polyangiaceae bacterium]
MTVDGSLTCSDLVSVDLTIPESKQKGRCFLSLNLLKTLDLGSLTKELGRQFVENDDIERLPLLRRALDLPIVTFETYRGETPPYELHAYIRATEVSDELIFATVLAPMPVVEQLASMPPYVVLETATLQAITEEPTTAAITAALETWARRVWPESRVPRILLSPWPGPAESREGSLEILRLFPTSGQLSEEDFTQVDLGEEFSPPPNLVAPEFRLTEEAA